MSPNKTKVSVPKDEHRSRASSSNPMTFADMRRALPSIVEKASRPLFMRQVQQALEMPNEVEHRLRVSSDYLATLSCPGGDAIKTVAATETLCSAYRYRGIGPFEESVMQAGYKLCSDFEARLIQLEDVIGDYREDLYDGQYAKLEEVPRMQKVDACLKEYKETLWQIIFHHVNSSRAPSPSASLLGNSTSGRFTMGPTTCIEINPSLCVTPTQWAISETITFEGEGGRKEPAMIYHTNKETLTDGYCLGGASSTRSGLYFELASQMCCRTETEDLTHQGILFDGFSAVVFLLGVASKSDLFTEHKAHVSEARYSLPDHRPVFVLDMINLLSSYEDHRKVFAHDIIREVYDIESRTFELVNPTRRMQ